MNEEEKQDEAYKKGFDRGVNVGLLIAAGIVICYNLIMFML